MAIGDLHKRCPHCLAAFGGQYLSDYSVECPICGKKMYKGRMGYVTLADKMLPVILAGLLLLAMFVYEWLVD